MRWSKKAQASIEFLMIVGVSMTMFLPMLFVFQQFSSQANEKVIVGQVNSFGRELVSSLESMYYFGEFSKTTIKFNFPDGIMDMTVNAPDVSNDGDYYEIVVTVFVYGEYADFVYFTKVPVAIEHAGTCSEEGFSYLSDFDGCTTTDVSRFDSREEAFNGGMKTFRIEALKNPTTKRLSVAIVRYFED